MVEAKKSKDIGMKRAWVLTQMPADVQLDVIAEGLPILMASADELLKAAEALPENARAAWVLQGHASEELSKVLILLDLVRCPAKLRASKSGTMVKWFYDHLARMIYADAQSWKPTTIDELQSYADSSRKSHSLEGYAGEYIMPNWSLYSRESMLYADIITHDDGEPMWNEPTTSRPLFGNIRPPTWEVVEILRDIGALTRPGLDIVADVWGKVEFSGDQECFSAGNAATSEMIDRLDAAGLISADATQEQCRWLYSAWQLPMYSIDFRAIEVSLEELKAEQDAALYAEMGISYADY
jgi:hypothetical protein